MVNWEYSHPILFLTFRRLPYKELSSEEQSSVKESTRASFFHNKKHCFQNENRRHIGLPFVAAPLIGDNRVLYVRELKKAPALKA